MPHTILIVDDSLTVRMDLAETFERSGFEPLCCSTVAEANRVLSGRTVDAVILDLLLPDGDGLEVLKEIRASDSSGAPVLMLSTEADVKDRVRGLQTGADDYVGKPYDTSYVVAKIRELLRQRSKESSHSTTVLVIDDSLSFRSSLQILFERAGYMVFTAESGEEGLRAAADLRPDAVIVDGVLPGIDGLTVIRRLRLDAALRGTPCVLLTASEDRDAELRALDAGADAFVRKDAEIDVVLAKLSAVLRSAENKKPVGPSESLLGPKRILAVDDSPTYLEEVSCMLRTDGYEVIPVVSGEDALELLSVQPVDCVLLDLVMPGLGGQETCRRIKETPIFREVPVIILTSIEDDNAMILALGSGADDYLSKSAEREVLQARIRAQLRRKQYEDENRRYRAEIHRSEMEAAEARIAREVAETRASMADELERKNKELEAFSYSVSHDLRAPLRAVDGFSRLLLESHLAQLDDEGQQYLHYIRESAKRMGELIEDLLALSRINRAELRPGVVNLSGIAQEVAAALHRGDADRRIEFRIHDGLFAQADEKLIKIVLENLMGNAWKFTRNIESACVEVGCSDNGNGKVFFVRDNGAGFNMTYAGKLFSPFQRLHSESEFPGTGIGLATVYRVIDRHGGRVWAEAAEGEGASFFFSLPNSMRAAS